MASIINLSSCKYAIIVFKNIDPFFLSDYESLGCVLWGYYNSRQVVNLIPGLDSVYIKSLMGYGHYEGWSDFVIMFEFSECTPVPDDLGIVRLWGRTLLIGQVIIGDDKDVILNYIDVVMGFKTRNKANYFGKWNWGIFYDLAVEFKGDFKRDWKWSVEDPVGLKVPGYEEGDLDFVDINRLDI